MGSAMIPLHPTAPRSISIPGGLRRLQYNKGGKVVNMSCYEAPVEVFDEPGAAVEWARLAYGAALRAKARSTGTTKR